ncbi:orexigenic neuropeptide QRFP [Oryctolagus cuniculus]|uniref:orexigenic neuropeptide QRFP n=1 Tax=Oryctolagus cuniculus TaxID=9986 RepID=UPI00222ED0DF|nr:orexigenic neuropeptide QRFP [Oryctolagus cuniculus]
MLLAMGQPRGTAQAGVSVASNSPLSLLGQMRSPRSLPYLLLLPLGACFPLLDRRAPLDTGGGGGAGRSWAYLAEGPRPHLARGTSRGLRAPAPRALLVLARQLQTWGQEHTGFHFRFGREDEGTDADGGDKAAGLLGSLAEELGGYSRKKGGFSFRFGRR